jgi:hypothetical protein
VTKGDAAVEQGSRRLRELSERLAAKGGAASKLAQPLAEDAAFLRKLKPSLIKARAKGEAPVDGRPTEPAVAPSGPQLGQRPKATRGKGLNPFLVIGAALAAGILLAKVVDWRSHAHPRG